MRRLLLIPFLVLALAACGGDDVQEPGDGSAAATSAAGTNLVVTVWADPATGAEPTVTTVTATPAGATAKDFAAPDPNQMCTMIFGGPGKTTVTGTLDGVAVNATFTRSGGCEIARWDRVVELGLIPKGVGSI